MTEMFNSPKIKPKTGECRMCGRKMDTTNGNIGAACLRKLNHWIKIHSRKNHQLTELSMFDNLGEESNDPTEKITT